MKDFKYSNKSQDQLQDSIRYWLKRAYAMKHLATNPGSRIGEWVFDNPDDQLMFDSLYYKATTRGQAAQKRDYYTRTIMETQEEKKKRAWKYFWKGKAKTINWTSGGWINKGIKPQRYYRWRKMQYKDRFFDRYVFGGYRYGYPSYKFRWGPNYNEKIDIIKI